MASDTIQFYFKQGAGHNVGNKAGGRQQASNQNTSEKQFLGFYVVEINEVWLFPKNMDLEVSCSLLIKIDAAAEIQQRQCRWVETAAELLVVCPFFPERLGKKTV